MTLRSTVSLVALFAAAVWTLGCAPPDSAPKKSSSSSAASSSEAGAPEPSSSETSEADESAAPEASEPAAEEPTPAAESETDAPEPAAPEAAAPEAEASEPEPQAAAAAGAPADPNWGTLRGRFVLDGPAPERQTLNVTKDTEVCLADGPILSDELVVSEDGGVADVVVALYLSRGDTPPEAHPSYAETAEAKIELDNASCRFVPHVAVLRTTQTLLIKNSDTVAHNTKIDPIRNSGSAINPILPPSAEVEANFPSPEPVPIGASCSIHPWMSAKVVVVDHPYATVTAADGSFEISNLPVGTWTFSAWHEKKGYVDQVTVGGASAKWTRGRFEQEIKAGDNDLGDVKLAPSLFGL